MNILNLVNRSLEVSESVKNSDKVFVFNGMNATSESLLQNLLFRLENHAPNSKIYIKQTHFDSIENSDIQYSWYRDDAETSKAYATALKFSGAFNTPIEVLSKESKFLDIRNNHTSVIFIDTEGSFELNQGHRQVSENIENVYKFGNNTPIDVMFIQGYLTTIEEKIAISKSNPFASNYNTLTGDMFDDDERVRAQRYMLQNLSNDYDRAYMLSSKIMNVLNNYITENMKLEFSKSITILETIETGFAYFDKSVDLFSDFLISTNTSDAIKTRINNIILDKVTDITKAISEEPEFYNNHSEESACNLFIYNMSTSKLRNVINYTYRTSEREVRNNLNETMDIIQTMSHKLQVTDIIYNSMTVEKRKVFHLAFYELARDIIGGNFTW